MTAPDQPSSAFGRLGQWSLGLPAALIPLVAILVYLPSLRFGFVGWDDTRYITESPLMTQPGGLARIWTTGEADQYYPLTYTMFWIEYAGWRDRPVGYHAVNIVLHSVNSLVLLVLLRRLGLSRWTACAATLLFVVHPVQVMSVAWIAERKNLLSCLFTLGALYAWTRFRQGASDTQRGFATGASPRPGRAAWYAASLIAFTAALLSKTASLTLPVALVALDRCAWRVPWRTSLRAVALFLVPAMGAALVTVVFEREFISPLPGIGTRALGAAAAVWFYVFQLLAPIRLLPIYPQWNLSASLVAWWLPALALALTGVAGWHWRRHLSGVIGCGLVHFLVFLFPVLGLISYGNLALTFVSDHYLYLPSIGLFIIIAHLLHRVYVVAPRKRVWLTGVGSAILLGASAVTLAYMPVFKDAQTMWGRVVEGNPACPAAHGGLGRVDEHRGNWSQALEHYRRAAELAPYVEALIDVARALRHLGRLDEAEQVLLRARVSYPQSPDLLAESARVAQRARRFEEAEAWFGQALALDQNHATLHLEMGAFYLGLSRRPEAERHFRVGVGLQPGNAKAYLGLATSLRGQQRFLEAVETLRTGLRAVPQDIAMLNFLARVLATATDDAARNGAQAVALAQEADRLTHSDNYEVLDTLAAAYAEAGRWAEAAATVAQAIERAEAAGDQAFANALRQREAGYRNHEPLRETATTVYRSPGPAAVP